jgi:hypothetical protein
MGPRDWSRLAELEETAAGPTDHDPPAGMSAHVDDPASPAPGPATLSESSRVPIAMVVAPQPDHDDRSTRRARVRLPWIIAAIAVIVAIGSVATLAVSVLTDDSPSFAFPVAPVPDEVDRPGEQSMLGFWGTGDEGYDYRGTIGDVDVWSIGDSEMRCILFSVDGDFVAQNCAPPPLAVIFETMAGDDDAPFDVAGDEILDGSYVRFMWADDTLDVYVVPPSELERA